MKHLRRTDDRDASRKSGFDALLSKIISAGGNPVKSRGHSGNRRRRARTRHVYALALIALSLALGLMLTNGSLWRLPSSVGDAAHRAAVIDELSLTNPNPSFIQNVTASLRSSGYSVDYYPPIQVTVELFRNLPSKDYGLIIIRSHTAVDAGIITDEPYSQSKYVYEQLTNQLVDSVVPYEPPSFAIAAGFVGSEMQGQLPDSTVILMGCAGLRGNPDLARAFVDRGAKFVVGWDDVVTAWGTDTATTVLVHRLTQGLTVNQAVALARSYPDPVYNSHLGYLSWDQVSGQRLNSFLYNLANGSVIVVLLVLGPAIAILIPKILGGTWSGLAGRKKNYLELRDATK